MKDLVNIDTSGIGALEELNKSLVSQGKQVITNEGINISNMYNTSFCFYIYVYELMYVYVYMCWPTFLWCDSVSNCKPHMASYSQAKGCQLCEQNWWKSVLDCWGSCWMQVIIRVLIKNIYMFDAYIYMYVSGSDVCMGIKSLSLV